VRTWFTIFALSGFLMQHFLCCSERCAACADPVAALAHADESPHDHDHESPQHGGDHSHPLCISTHLFFTTSASAPSLPGDLQTAALCVPGMIDGPAAADVTVATADPVPPPSRARLRAARGVWTL
jgi:hypothetical protein